MKLNLFIVNVIAVLITGTASAQKPQIKAFPEAEGFGSNTPGGRGGKVLIVSNLNDAGPGSFREACETEGPRIVVFRVSGLIDLKTPLNVTKPYITIAGQTAPGDGICLKRSEFKIYTHDAIVRFIRSRPGDISGKEMDAMGVGNNAHDVIIDHCSANWSIDESLSPSGSIYNVTMQWCLVGQALDNSVHKKGSHGFGSLVRGIGGISLHHNLWIDNEARNPRLGDNYNTPPWPVIDVRNNVMYNWGKMCTGMTGGNVSANYIANYLYPGPGSSKMEPIVLTETSKVKFFIEGNIVVGRPDYAKKPATMFTSLGKKKLEELFELKDKPFDAAPIKTTSAEQAYKDVLAKVGANRPVRDRVDEELILQVKTNTGKFINSQSEAGGWPVYRIVKAAKDTDGDGIPDSWEISNHLNPEDAADASKPSHKGDGYTNIEKYINGLI